MRGDEIPENFEKYVDEHIEWEVLPKMPKSKGETNAKCVEQLKWPIKCPKKVIGIIIHSMADDGFVGHIAVDSVLIAALMPTFHLNVPVLRRRIWRRLTISSCAVPNSLVPCSSTQLLCCCLELLWRQRLMVLPKMMQMKSLGAIVAGHSSDSHSPLLMSARWRLH